MAAEKRKKPSSSRLSRSLSKVLRHQAVELGITVRSDGYCTLDSVLEALRLQDTVTLDEIQSLVAKDNKQRFSLLAEDDGKVLIRCNQGHSMPGIDPHLLLTPLRAAQFCCHGTYLEPWEDSIRRDGLSRMQRNHIHFAARPYQDGSTVSGIRRDVEILIYLDMRSALQDGIPFFRSMNGVILSPGDAEGFLRPKYFLRVEERKTGKILFGERHGE